MLARLAALADLGVVATGNVHFAAPAQARLGQALAAIRARRSLADMDGWLPAAGTAYLRSGAEMAARLRRYPGVLRAHRRAGPGVRVRLHGDRPPPARLRCPGRAHRSLLAARAGRAEGPGPLRAARRRTGARRVRPDRQGARRDRAAGVRRLLPDRAQHRRVLRGQRHLVPGPRVGGEFGGLLRDRHHQRRPGLAPPAVRAVPVRRPGRAAGHRPGHRAPPPRGGHPVRLPHLRPGPGRPGRQRDLLPAADGAAGCRARARPHAGRGRRLGAGDRTGPARRWGGAAGQGPSRGGGAGGQDAAAAAASRHPLGRHGDLRPPGGGGVPGGVGADARPHRAAVGQGRLRLRGPGQVRPARPGHAGGAARLLRPGGRPSRRALDDVLHPAGGPGRLPDAGRGGHGGRVPGGVPRPDGHPAAAAAAAVLQPGHRGRADQAGPDPGGFGAPVPAPPRRPRGRGHAARVDAAGAGQDAGRAAVPGADDAAGHRLRGVHAGRGRPAAPGDERQAGPGTHRPSSGSGCSTGWPSAASAPGSPRTSTPRSWPSPTTGSPSRTRSASPTWSTPARG